MLPLESTSQKPPSSHSFHDSRSAPQRISRIKSHQRTGGLDQESGIKTWSCGQIHVVRPTNSWDNEPISRNGCFFHHPYWMFMTLSLQQYWDSQTINRGLEIYLRYWLKSNMRGEPGQTIEHKPNTNQTQPVLGMIRLNHQFYGEVIVML